MDATAERRENADPPVPNLVAEALHDDRLVRGHGTGGRLLLTQEGDEVQGGSLVEQVVLPETLDRLRLGQRDQLPRGLPDGRAELVRAPDALALPERDGARHARRRRHEHAVAGDLLDPPGRGAEQERLPRARLVDHLLVELAHAPAAVDEMDAEEAAVGDGAGIRHRELARALTTADRAARAVPDDPGPQLGELVGRIAAGEHVEHVLELDARELREGIRATHERVQVVDRDFLVGADGDDLLREDVERVSRDRRLLDLACAHLARDDGGLEQVGAELREDAPARDGAQLVAGAADTLEAAGDGLRRLDLDHQVDGAHVDAELERGGRDEAGDLPALQQLLDLEPLLTRDRAVVGARDLFLRQLVEAEREAFRESAVVDEDDGGAVGANELEQLRVDGRPDRLRPALSPGSEQVGQLGARRGLAHVLDRDDDLEVELLRAAGVDEPDRATARHEAPDLLHRALRRRERDALDVPVDEPDEALDAEREVGAALRPGDGVDLVQDHRLDGSEHLAGARGEDQKERLGRRDQDVRWLAAHRLALLRRRVAGTDRDR